jgi:glycosyltransferase involved in cell wall biosynthesis
MKICLLLIVKNSGDILRETLRSFLPYVDSWCISDTGSTDHTLEIIRQEGTGKEGYLFQEAFRDFSYNRNRVIEEAENRFPDHYYVMIDDSYELHNPESFRTLLTTKCDYPLYCVHLVGEESVLPMTLIFTKGFRYKYRIHEYIESKKKAILLDSFFFVDKKNPEHRQRTAERYQFDIDQLLLDLKEMPEDSRLMFYLARTYFLAGNIKEAGEWFKKRILVQKKNRRACPEEAYQSMMYIASISFMTHDPVGKRLDLYTGIHQLYPLHPEPLYFGALCLEQMGKTEKAIELLEKAYDIYTNKKSPLLSYRHKICNIDLPKRLCCHYFKTNVQKCVLFLLTHYIDKNLAFDFQFESYVRYIFKIAPTHRHHDTIVYSEKLPSEELESVLPEDYVLFTEENVKEYQIVTTSYAIDHVIVVDRTDRIPFFPNVKHIYLLFQERDPDFSLMITFPTLSYFIAKDKEYLMKEYVSATDPNRVLDYDQWRAIKNKL